MEKCTGCPRRNLGREERKFGDFSASRNDLVEKKTIKNLKGGEEKKGEKGGLLFLLAS